MMADSRRKKALIAFYLIAFGVPWIGWTVLAILDPPQGSGLWWSLLLTGNFCSVGGIVALYIEKGSQGLVEIGRRLIDVKHPFGWWLYALGICVVAAILCMVLYGSTHGGIGRVDPKMLLTLFGPASLLRMVTGPLGEEFGWRGFLLPRFLERYSPLAAGLMVGGIWGIWHLPAYHALFLHDFPGTVVFMLGAITQSMLLTVLFVHTRGSLCLAILLHWTGNAALNAVRPMFPDIQPDSPATLILFRMLVTLAIAVVVVFIFRDRMRRRPVTAAPAATGVGAR